MGSQIAVANQRALVEVQRLVEVVTEQRLTLSEEGPKQSIDSGTLYWMAYRMLCAGGGEGLFWDQTHNSIALSDDEVEAITGGSFWFNSKCPTENLS